MTDEEIDRMADNFVNAQDFTRVYSVARKAECGAFWKYGFLAGLKASRPKWHKVADGDLPKKVDDYVTNIGILTYDNYGNGVHKWHTPYCEACDYADEVGDDEVIAWCEIPKYTEEQL